MNSVLSATNLIYIILGIATILGGLLVLRRSSTKATNDAMEQLNKTLADEISALRRRMDDLERERATQDRVIATIRQVLKEYHLRVTIQGDVVTVSDTTGNRKSATVKPQAIIKPMVTEDEDDAS